MTEADPIQTDVEQKTPSGAAGVIRVIARMLLTAVVGIALGIGVYFGVPALYRQYIEPVRINSERIEDLDQTVSHLQADQSQWAEDANARLAAMEGQLATQAETLATLQADLERVQTELTRQGRQVTGLADLSGQVDELRASLEAVQAEVAALQGNDAPTQRLARQIQLLRAMELLTRARIWLTQNNVGLAGDDVRLAREILAALAEMAPADEADLEPIVARLDLALTDLRSSPVVAADDIEIAWQLLVDAMAPSLPLSQEE